MKDTFLVLNDPKNPKSGLRVASTSEWDRILKANKKLPREQRRFLITDSCSGPVETAAKGPAETANLSSKEKAITKTFQTPYTG